MYINKSQDNYRATIWADTFWIWIAYLNFDLVLLVLPPSLNRVNRSAKLTLTMQLCSDL